VGAIDPGECAVARRARAALNGRHSLKLRRIETLPDPSGRHAFWFPASGQRFIRRETKAERTCRHASSGPWNIRHDTRLSRRLVGLEGNTSSIRAPWRGPFVLEDRMDIKEHMEVIGADGVHVGTVDRMEGGRIKLTKKDSGEGSHKGHHHFVDK